MLRHPGRVSVALRAQGLFAAAGLVVASVTGAGGIARGSDPLLVQVSTGALHGVADGSMNEWRGVPYAAPPVGALRWRSPAPPAAWTGVRDASQFGTHCIQIDFEGGTLGGEDCLYLNVFVPAGTPAGAHLPVMVHLHPGGNTFGWGYETGGSGFYDSVQESRLVDHGAIVVTINYRLGVFGVVGHPALTAEGSLPEEGMLDQIAALHWVHGNIAVFGGDPGNVTLFGMSSGSFDTVALAASPLASGLFARAAVETDAFWPATGVGNSLSDKERFGLGVASAVGCSSSADVAACLRSTPADALVLALGFADIGPLIGGSVLPISAMAVFQERGAGVPLLIGSNREEGSLVVGTPDQFTNNSANIGPSNHFRHGDFVRNVADLVGTQNQGRALQLYPTGAYDSLAWDFITMATDAVYTCPVRRLALSASDHAPTYRYLFTHVMENDPDQAFLRAFHTLEDTFLWHHFYPLASGAPYSATTEEDSLSATMAAYWTNFARTGDPNGAGLPAWPRYERGQERTLLLDDNVLPYTGYHVAQCGLMDALPQPFPACGSLCHFYTQAQFWHRFRN